MGIRKVPACELPHIAHRAALQHLPRNFPHLEIFVVKISGFVFLIGHQDRIRSRLQRRPHDGKHLGKLSRALFEDLVRPPKLLLGPLLDLKNAARGPQDGGPDLFRFAL